MHARVLPFVAVLSLYSHQAFAQSRGLPVVPLPREVTFADGSFELAPDEVAIRITDTAGVATGLEALVQAFDEAFGERPALDGDAPRVIHLGLPDQDAAFARLARDAGIWPDERVGDEGYTLAIESRRIVVAARRPAGLFYGIQTLRQLVRAYGDEGRVPAVRIVDWPDLQWRGLMDDISRGPIPTMAYLKEQVRRLAEMKLNVFSHYVEHVVATESHGDFAPPEAITIEQLRELSDYAKRYHVTVVGNFQSFGHFQQILSHPRYTPLGEGLSLLSPAFEESYELLQDIYDELVPVFDAPFFNVNADETFDLGRGASKQRVDSLGPGVVYAEHVNRLHKLVTRHGTRMMIWGDILLHHPEVIPLIPEDVIIGAWDYSARESFDEYIVPFKEAGLDVVVTPGVLNSSRIMPDFRESFANISHFVRDGVEHGSVGMLMTVWDDGGSALFERDWLGVAYSADQAWNSNPSDETFSERFSRGLYGDESRAIVSATRLLNELADLAPTDGMNEQVFWTNLVPPKGESVQINLQDWDRVVEIADSAQAVLDAATSGPHSGEIDAFRFTAEQYRHMARSRRQLLAAANAYREATLLQTEDRAAARDSVLSALHNVSATHAGLLALHDQYRELWLRESRTYALDRVLALYRTHLDALHEVESLLMDAIEDFDRGFYLPPPTEVRLAIEETDGWFFREWMSSGPIAAVGKPSDLEIDYLEAMGGEENARPEVTQEFQYADATYRWHRIASPQFAVVDLAAQYERNEDAVLYAHAMIDAPAAERVRALVGSNDGIEVFVNGQKVHSKAVIRTLTIDEDEIWLPLAEGRNHLLLKISQGSGDWAFTFRLPDKEIRSRKNRYRIVG
ncbi:MAG TPA: beta-N-acetylhexosaminidase [Rhodothermales bacterium]